MAVGALALYASTLRGGLLFGDPAGAASAPGGGLAPLSSVPVPLPSDLSKYVRDKPAAVALGKALFWDMQAGSDGSTACASCHFANGTDTRSRNTLNPGAGGASAFFSPNRDLTEADYPFHQLLSADDRDSTVLFDTAAVTGSQGVTPSHFGGVVDGSQVDQQTYDGADPIFSIGGVNVRRVTGRNTPSIINAIFNFRNFWDGRAQNDFNGVDPFGSRDPGARVAVASPGGDISLTKISIANASIASQAVGPPVNSVEMSAAGRQMRDVGRKLLALTPLARQEVAPTDSALGGLANAGGRGLHTTYARLVEAAFEPKWWSSDSALLVDRNGAVTILPRRGPLPANQYTQMQYNWALFWGLAIDLYASSLVSDQTPLDRFLAGDKQALTPLQQKGLQLFQSSKASCSVCHAGPELTSASVSNVTANGPTSTFDFAGKTVITDTGFANNGVRPTSEDPGNGGGDPFGNPLSIARLTALPGPVAVDGTFKVPGLRNVALTAPYFHNGGDLTLEEVVEFYDRGGNFANPQQNPLIRPLGLKDSEDEALIAFLQALTDPRVVGQRAPFDHPQLFVSNGHEWAAPGSLLGNGSGGAADNFIVIPATGANGGAALPSFPSAGTPGSPPPLH